MKINLLVLLVWVSFLLSILWFSLFIFFYKNVTVEYFHGVYKSQNYLSELELFQFITICWH